ncbi:MAG: right-handed parallel beta-helix repeat-containing protein [Cyanobacteria bacterium J06636_16]
MFAAGEAAGTFDGPEGTYQVVVGYYDENDGTASADITVAGQNQKLTFDRDLPSGAPTAETLTQKTTHSAIELKTGDTFKITGKLGFAEFARFDYIDFIPVPDSGNKTEGEGGDAPVSDPVDNSDRNTETTYYVSPNGSDDNPGTQEQPWKTINHAVSEDSTVAAGDTILVQPGEYTEVITLEKSGTADLGHITLKADGDVTLIDPDPKGGIWHEGVIQSAGEGYWKIDGFRIENTSFAGISLRDANNMIVQNNHTFETGASGIIVMPDTYFEGGEQEVTSKDIQVLNNTIERANWRWEGSGDTKGTQEALSIWGVDGFEVANNLVREGKREGIDVKTGSRNGSVYGNTVTGVAQLSGTPSGYNGGPAIYVDGNRADTFNVAIYDNTVYGNVADGIAIADEDPERGDVTDIRIYNNVVYDNGRQGVNQGAGIAVSSNVSDVEILNNTVTDNVQAIVVDGTDFTQGSKTANVVMRNNIFANSTYRNGFIEDAKSVILNKNLFTDGFEQMFEGGSQVEGLADSGNLSVSSVGFVNRGSNDYRLRSQSAAVDAGSNTIPSYLTTDKDGKQRNVGVAVDLGAFEFGA